MELDCCTKSILFLSLTGTAAALILLWYEGVWGDFYRWGPPFQIGTIVIKTWEHWWGLVFLLIVNQTVTAYVEETVGKHIEHAKLVKQSWTHDFVYWMALFNMFKWFGMILHIFIAVTRFDMWVVIAVIDTVLRALVWKASVPSTLRQRRYFN